MEDDSAVVPSKGSEAPDLLLSAEDALPKSVSMLDVNRLDKSGSLGLDLGFAESPLRGAESSAVLAPQRGPQGTIELDWSSAVSPGSASNAKRSLLLSEPKPRAPPAGAGKPTGGGDLDLLVAPPQRSEAQKKADILSLFNAPAIAATSVLPPAGGVGTELDKKADILNMFHAPPSTGIGGVASPLGAGAGASLGVAGAPYGRAVWQPPVAPAAAAFIPGVKMSPYAAGAVPRTGSFPASPSKPPSMPPAASANDPF